MNTSVEIELDDRVQNVCVSRDSLTVALRDGRSISVPLAWYPRLLRASPEERNAWEPCGAGHGIHWPLVDEHLSVEGLLRGSPSPEVRVRHVAA
jgi:hypothetical protein